MTPETFRALRERLGLTQTEWGRWLGVHRVNVNAIEAGRKRIGPTLALLLERIERDPTPPNMPPDRAERP